MALAATPIVAASSVPASAQMAETPLGPIAPGGTGMRGTTDAVPEDNPTGFSAQPQTTDTATLNRTAMRKKKFTLPKLRNTALPERYPVALTPLVPYPRVVRLKGTAPAEEAAPDAVPPPSVAALPVPARRVFRPQDDPFAPVGYDVGTLRLTPYIEQSVGYDTNPEQIETGVKGSAFSRTEGGFALLSNWSSHELKGTMHGAYDDFFNDPRANRPDANGVVDLRVDVTRDTKIDAEGRFNIDTERPGSPELNVAVRDRPLIESYGGTLGATQGFGRFSVGLHGLIDRTTYEDAVLDNGHPVPLAYQDVTDYGIKPRIAYDLKPGLQPFVEFGVDRRIHDETVDPFGYRRDSDGIGGRVGTSFEFWPQLTGLASVGYAMRQYDDERLRDLKGPTADGSLIWAATPLTTITVNGSTSFNETTVIGASGIKTYTAGVAISHALFRSLTLTAAFGYEHDEYIGVPIVEQTLTESLKAEYHLTRSLVLTGTLSRQELKSTAPGSDYTQNIALVGLRLQH